MSDTARHISFNADADELLALAIVIKRARDEFATDPDPDQFIIKGAGFFGALLDQVNAAQEQFDTPVASLREPAHFRPFHPGDCFEGENPQGHPFTVIDEDGLVVGFFATEGEAWLECDRLNGDAKPAPVIPPAEPYVPVIVFDDPEDEA